MKGHLKILVVDDDKLWKMSFIKRLQIYGEVDDCDSEVTGIKAMERKHYDLCFFDLDLAGSLKGLELISLASQRNIYSIVVSAHDHEDIVTEAYNRGTIDFLSKPLSPNALEEIFKRYYVKTQQDQIITQMKKRFITQSDALNDGLELLTKINLSSAPLLLTGESGTGKSLLAQIVHELTQEKDAPFIALNCSQFNESTLTSEIFGHVKGSFTGATKDKEGLLKKADGGTLFLDEIHSLSAAAQQKLLTTLETGVFYPLGSERPTKSSFKLISATCENLNHLIAEKEFREDLYYRIKTFLIEIPPLRERKEDVILNFKHFLEQKERRIIIDHEAKYHLENYSWPGNSREIRDLVENWHIEGHGVITKKELPSYIFTSKHEEEFAPPLLSISLIEHAKKVGLKTCLDDVKLEIIKTFLQNHHGKQVLVAQELKTSESSISKIIKKPSKSFYEDQPLSPQ